MQRVFVIINCDVGSERSLIEQLKRLEHVKEVHGTLGSYDIVAILEAQKIETLRETVKWKIRGLDHVRSTLSLIGIEGVNKEKEMAELIPNVMLEKKKPKEAPSSEDFLEKEEDEEEDYDEEKVLNKIEKN